MIKESNGNNNFSMKHACSSKGKREERGMEQNSRAETWEWMNEWE